MTEIFMHWLHWLLRGPEAPPCPLDLHLLAPEVAEMVRRRWRNLRVKTTRLVGSNQWEFCQGSGFVGSRDAPNPECVGMLNEK